MKWLNYHRLLDFWVVAKQGSITRASKELRLAHPTISAQIHLLEEVSGHKPFERRSRQLVLTEFGRVTRTGQPAFARDVKAQVTEVELSVSDNGKD